MKDVSLFLSDLSEDSREFLDSGEYGSSALWDTLLRHDGIYVA